MCLGTIVYGHNRVWAQLCLGTIVSGHSRLWAQSCGPSRVGPIMYGHKRGGTLNYIAAMKINFITFQNIINFITVMLPKYVGKLLTNELLQKINNSIGYFLIISIDFSCNNFLIIYNNSIIFPFTRSNELKIYIIIDGEAIKDCIPLPFVRQLKMSKVTKL